MRIPMRAIRKIVIVPVAVTLGLVALGAPLAQAAAGDPVPVLDNNSAWSNFITSDGSVPSAICDGADGGDAAYLKIFVNQTGLDTENVSADTQADLTVTYNDKANTNGVALFPYTSIGVNDWIVSLDNTGLLDGPGAYNIDVFCVVITGKAPAKVTSDTTYLGRASISITAITSTQPILLPVNCTTTITAGGFAKGKTVTAVLSGSPLSVVVPVGTGTADGSGNVSVDVFIPPKITPYPNTPYYLELKDTSGNTTDPQRVFVTDGACIVPPSPTPTPGDVVAANSTVTPDAAAGLLTLGTARQSIGIDPYNIGIALKDKDGKVVTGIDPSTLSVANLPVGATAKFTANADGTFILCITSTVPGWIPVQVLYTADGADPVAIGAAFNVAFIGAAVTDDQVAANGTETVVGYGFWPGETVYGIVHSNPMKTAGAVADMNGKVTITFSVAQLAKGDHTVQLQGDKSGITATVPFSVCQIVSTGGSVVTSSAATTGIVVMLMMVAGLGVAAVRMRRSTL